jgi:hypothetical protein
MDLLQQKNFLEAFTKFINRFLSGKVPSGIATLLVSGTLVPIIKKDGGIRPIVVGEVIRRLISKLCVTAVFQDAREYLQPLQLGVGEKGGCEAVLHAFNRSIRNPDLDPASILSLMDFKNAFNEVKRESFLEEVRLKFPCIYPWVYFSYSSEAPLFIEDKTIFASTGVQQGDPLGPLLFALVLHPLLLHIKSEFSLQVGAILDDVTIMGTPNNTLNALNYIGREGPKRGLYLSSKTTLWSPFYSPIPDYLIGWSFSGGDGGNFSLTISSEKGVCLLGGGVSCDSDFLASFAEKRFQKWSDSINLLMEFKDPFIQLLLLRSCLGFPKLNYLLRCTPPNLINQTIIKMERLLRDTLKSIVTGGGPGFGEFQFRLSTLPVCDSGLGIYNPADIGYFAYISSVSQTKDLQDLILDNPDIGLPVEFQTFRQLFIDTFNNKKDIALPQFTQSKLADIFFKVRREMVLNDLYITQQNSELQHKFLAALESSRQPHASAYLFAIPNPGFNQVMSPKEFRADMALRLLMPKFSGILICNKERCGKPMDLHGYHAINCRGSFFARHEIVVKALHSLAFEAGIQSQIGAPVQCLGVSSYLTSLLPISSPSLTAFRPADVLMTLNDAIRKTCVDVTVVSPIKAHMPVNFVAGKDAKSAENEKFRKHEDACREAGYEFIPFAVDAFGGLAPESLKLLRLIASNLEVTKNCSRNVALNIVFRRISFSIHLGVARQLVDRMESGSFF